MENKSRNIIKKEILEFEILGGDIEHTIEYQNSFYHSVGGKKKEGKKIPQSFKTKRFSPNKHTMIFPFHQKKTPTCDNQQLYHCKRQGKKNESETERDTLTLST